MKCATRYCKGKAAEGRRICHKCRSRKYRDAHPDRSCYQALKDNSKRRGKAFHLSFEQFIKFCQKTDYLAGRGRKKESLSIDRIENDKGYTPDNIRPMPLSENSRKGAKVLSYDWMTGYATVSQSNRGGV